ncbi:hypothetical protein O6P43_032565 [Quillaja saponaria]|uniref:Uncharacterized protein n=1 Tax=Quillaja saponaria TaxID=32244 RepID=A0AAD7P5N5_QUISA|nr:hypothetical protein O6P43_032565 [Quillaja saponaria]
MGGWLLAQTSEPLVSAYLLVAYPTAMINWHSFFPIAILAFLLQALLIHDPTNQSVRSCEICGSHLWSRILQDKFGYFELKLYAYPTSRPFYTKHIKRYPVLYENEENTKMQ